jgi:hypothetical protein
MRVVQLKINKWWKVCITHIFQMHFFRNFIPHWSLRSLISHKIYCYNTMHTFLWFFSKLNRIQKHITTTCRLLSLIYSMPCSNFFRWVAFFNTAYTECGRETWRLWNKNNSKIILPCFFNKMKYVTKHFIHKCYLLDIISLRWLPPFCMHWNEKSSSLAVSFPPALLQFLLWFFASIRW